MQAIQAARDVRRATDEDLAAGDDMLRNSIFLSKSFGGTDTFFEKQKVAAISRPFVSRVATRCASRDELTTDIECTPVELMSTVMFVDISGYSKTAAALASQGAHALAEVVNGYFARILDVVEAHEGDVLKFAGDAVMVAWYHEDATRSAVAAARCSLELQQKCEVHETPAKGEDGKAIALRLHIGVTSGLLGVAVLQPTTPSSVMPQAFLSVDGRPLQKLGPVVDAAKSGEVCVDDKVKQLCEKSASAAAKKLRFERVPDEPCWRLTGEPVHSGAGSPTDGAVADPKAEAGDGPTGGGDDEPAGAKQLLGFDERFVPPRVLARLKTGIRAMDMAELRFLHILFIKQTGAARLEDWFEDVHGVLARFGVAVTQVIDDDKGPHVVAALGLYVAEDNAGDRVVACLRELHRLASCAVGVAAGTCFCGIVGNDRVRRWDITGAPCVRSCRLMQLAEKEGVATRIDESVFPTVEDISQVVKRGTAVVKGSSEEVVMYDVAETTEHPIASFAAVTVFAAGVRAGPRAMLRRTIIDDESVERTAALVTGPPQSGKRMLLLTAVTGAGGFTPIAHVVTRDSTATAVCGTLGRWAACHERDAVRASAAAVLETLKTGSLSRAIEATVRLIDVCVAEGLRVAVVVRKCQFMDASLMGLMHSSITAGATAVPSGEGESTAGTPRPSAITDKAKPSATTSNQDASVQRGRWLWLMTLTPMFGGCTASRIEHSVLRFSRGPTRESPHLFSGTYVPNTPVSVAEGPGCTVRLETITAEEFLSLTHHFMRWGFSSSTEKAFLDKAACQPGWALRLLEWGVPIAFNRMVAIDQGRVPEAMRLARPNFQHGCFHFMPKGRNFIRDAKWRTVNERGVSTLTQYVDVLHPHDLVLLKATACITQCRVLPLWQVLCAVTEVFLDNTTVEELQERLHVLIELQILRGDLHDENSVLEYIVPPLAEVVSDLCTPAQASVVRKRMADALYRRSAPTAAGSGRSPSQLLDILRLLLPDGPNSSAATRIFKDLLDAVNKVEPAEDRTKWINSVSSVHEEAGDELLAHLDDAHRSLLKEFNAVPKPVVKEDTDNRAGLFTRSLGYSRSREAPLVLGPAAGMFERVTTHVGIGIFAPSESLERPVDIDHLMAISKRIDALVPKYETELPKDGYKTDEMSQRSMDVCGLTPAEFEEEWDEARERKVYDKIVNRRLEAPTDKELSQLAADQGHELVLLFEKQFRMRRKRLTIFVQREVAPTWDDLGHETFSSKIPESETILPKEAADRALRRAYNALRVITRTTSESERNAAVRTALTELGVGNWTSPHPYMTPAGLRDCWLKGWITTIEVKAILIVFGIEYHIRHKAPAVTTSNTVPVANTKAETSA